MTEALKVADETGADGLVIARDVSAYAQRRWDRFWAERNPELAAYVAAGADEEGVPPNPSRQSDPEDRLERGGRAPRHAMCSASVAPSSHWAIALTLKHFSLRLNAVASGGTRSAAPCICSNSTTSQPSSP